MPVARGSIREEVEIFRWENETVTEQLGKCSVPEFQRLSQNGYETCPRPRN